jgi:CRISPR-associated DxTHG motif protein
LGTVGHTQRVPYIDNGEIKYKFEAKSEEQKAYYSFDKRINLKSKKDKYFNMLPLMIENFTHYTHLPIYTKLSLKIQQSLLDFEKIDFDIKKNGLFVSEDIKDVESDYSYFLNEINKVIEEYDSVIVDMTHGFRHFPILAIINLIIQNIKNPKKVEYIFFAKEIEQYKKYEIIDLKEYLELANLSFMLSSFNQNYTVSSNIRFKNRLHKEIAKELSEFSHHFLSNSLKPLIDGNLISDIIDNLEELQKDKSVENFKHYITEIIEHLEDIRQLKYKNEWMRFYKLSQIMDKRGYQLNAITLLFEALGFYCLESFCKINIIKKRAKSYRYFIEKEYKPVHIFSTYTMVNDARVIIKKRNSFRILHKKQFINNEKLIESIVNLLNVIDNLDDFKDFIEEMEAFRNNLTHGNSSDSLDDVKLSYQKNLQNFEKIIIQEDILNIKKD